MKSKRFLALICSTVILTVNVPIYAAPQSVAPDTSKVSLSNSSSLTSKSKAVAGKSSTLANKSTTAVTNKSNTPANKSTIVRTSSSIRDNLTTYLSNNTTASEQFSVSFKDALKSNASNGASNTNITVGEIVLNHTYLHTQVIGSHTVYFPTDHVAIYMEEVPESAGLNPYSISDFSTALKSMASTIPYKIYDVTVSSQPALALVGLVKHDMVNIQLLVKSPTGKYYVVSAFSEDQSYYNDMVTVLNKLSFSNVKGTTGMSPLTSSTPQPSAQLPSTQPSAQLPIAKPSYSIVTGEYGVKYYKSGNLKFRVSPEYKVVSNINSNTILTQSSPDGLFTIEYSQMNTNGATPDAYAKKLQSDAQEQLKSVGLNYEVKLTVEPFGTHQFTDYRLDYLMRSQSKADIEQHIFFNNGVAHIFTWKGNSTYSDNAKYYVEFLSCIVGMEFE